MHTHTENQAMPSFQDSVINHPGLTAIQLAELQQNETREGKWHLVTLESVDMSINIHILYTQPLCSHVFHITATQETCVCPVASKRKKSFQKVKLVFWTFPILVSREGHSEAFPLYDELRAKLRKRTTPVTSLWAVKSHKLSYAIKKPYIKHDIHT